MFKCINSSPSMPLHDSAMTVTWQYSEQTGTYTTTVYSLPKVESIFQEEIRTLSEDIHQIIESTCLDWEKAKKYTKVYIEDDETYISEYHLPHINPISTRPVKAKVVSKGEGTVNLKFLEAYTDLFD